MQSAVKTAMKEEPHSGATKRLIQGNEQQFTESKGVAGGNRGSSLLKQSANRPRGGDQMGGINQIAGRAGCCAVGWDTKQARTTGHTAARIVGQAANQQAAAPRPKEEKRQAVEGGTACSALHQLDQIGAWPNHCLTKSVLSLPPA